MLALQAQSGAPCIIRGIVHDEKGAPIEAALVFVKNGNSSASTNNNGEYFLKTHAGRVILAVQLLGYEPVEQKLEIQPGSKQKIDITLKQRKQELKEVVVEGKSAVKRVRESAYNVTAVDASKLQNSSMDIAHALANVSGIRIRETGGVGSEAQISLNGFTGRHVKVFIDGVPMDGMGSSYQLNNIPINLADRIEVYKGVVPVGLGSDALGGAINVVTNQRKRTYADVSYSFGSFNTHRTSINAGFTTDKGFNVEVNAFQNYSDNNYSIYNAVKDLTSGQINTKEIERINRFHDQYHNETLILKAGFVNRSFADRMYVSLNVGSTYKQIQNGVTQNVVFGQKFNRGSSVMPSFLYNKKNMFLKGLDVNLTANYNRNITQNVDTATFEYNWKGEKRYTGKLGEQSYTESKYGNDNWNSTFTANYRLNDVSSFMLNDVFTSFNRKTISIGQDATTITATDTMPKRSNKNVLGVSYKLAPSRLWNLSAFAKQYHQSATGPEQSATNAKVYNLKTGGFDALGYGAAGTLFIADLQTKLSYEKSYRLPTDNEMFGDEDLEHSSLGLKPESSDNYNINFGYSHVFAKKHAVSIDAGFMYRDVKDYIKRVVESASNLYYATNINFGKVHNWGINAEAHYSFKELLTVGANFTYQDIRDYENSTQTTAGSSTYKVRMPNTPYLFSSGDVTFSFRDFLSKGNRLSVGYSNNFVYEFPLEFENLGQASTKDRVPTQFSHDASLTYTLKNGRYNISLECRNLTDEKLYDNFSLQKPGRAFSAKLRYYFSK